MLTGTHLIYSLRARWFHLTVQTRDIEGGAFRSAKLPSSCVRLCRRLITSRGCPEMEGLWNFLAEVL